MVEQPTLQDDATAPSAPEAIRSAAVSAAITLTCRLFSSWLFQTESDAGIMVAIGRRAAFRDRFTVRTATPRLQRYRGTRGNASPLIDGQIRLVELQHDQVAGGDVDRADVAGPRAVGLLLFDDVGVELL